MFRKVMLVMVGLALASLMIASTRGTGQAVYAEGNDDFNVTLTLTGTVVQVTSNTIILTDGTTLRIIAGKTSLPANLGPGVVITIVAEIDDEDLVAITITITLEGTPTAEPTTAPTVEPTVEPTVAPTVEPTVEPTTEPTVVPTMAADCGGNTQQPVALRLSNALGVTYDEIMGWHCKGYGFGEIARAYLLAKNSAGDANPLTVDGIFALRASGQGWGQIVKASGVSPSKLSLGKALKDNEDPKGNGNGKGNSNDKGNGKGNGNNKGNGNGKGN